MIGIIMWLSRGAVRPRDYDSKEYWTWKPAGEKPLIFRIFSRRGAWEDSRNEDKPHLAMDGESTVSLRPSVLSRLGSAAEDKGPARRPRTPQPFRTLP